jgi:2-polyprenyl-3-methyl-5-hydroxy-6-metoxy-1,4-benzoquinol methylase
MGVLLVGSNNPNFSHIIQKNPNTITEKNEPYKKSVRQGMAYGWFTPEAQSVLELPDSEFKLWFRDHTQTSSFANGIKAQFEYLDKTRYASPYLPISLITLCLNTAHKKRDDLDIDGFQAYAEFPIHITNPHYAESFIRSYDDAQIQLIPMIGHYQKVVIVAPTVHQVLNLTISFCLMQALRDYDAWFPLDDVAVAKYIHVLNSAQAPYYVRYLFSSKVLQNRKSFAKYKNLLENNGDHDGQVLNLKYGNTRQQRFDAVSLIFSEGDTLIDLGCGELFYSMRLSSKYDSVVAVDKDEEGQEYNTVKVKNKGLDNVSVLTQEITAEWILSQQYLFEGADILLTEVVEHMEQSEATALINALIAVNVGRIIITVPNKDFNKHYAMEEGETRHDDHKWEPTATEFELWLETLNWPEKMSGGMSGIGDCVDGEYVSLLAYANLKPQTVSLTSATAADFPNLPYPANITFEISDPEFESLPSAITQSVELESIEFTEE